MKSVSFKAFVLVVASVALLACGKKLSEQERSYAEACIKMNEKMVSKVDDVRKLCECAATIVVPKLTPGELKAYLASPDLMGKPMTDQSVAPLGFTLQEFLNIGKKRKEQDWPAELKKTCGRETF